jgi:hypothetical protein
MRKNAGCLIGMPGMGWVVIMTVIMATGLAQGQTCGVKPGGMVKEYRTGDDGSVQGWTEREFDDRGRLLRESGKDAGGKVIRSREWTYDSAGRAIKTVDRDSKGDVVYLQERLYNDNGKLTKDYTEERGRVTLWTEYTYDEKGNMAAEIHKDPSGTAVKTFEYDTGWSLKQETKDADPFKVFYIRFKSSRNYQRDHTRFPLEVVILRDGEGRETAQKKKVSKKEWRFTDFNSRDWEVAIMKTDKDSPDESALRLRGKKDRGVLVHYRFKKIKEKWYLVEVEDLSR